MRTFAVINPASGNGQTGRRWNALYRQIEASIGPFEALHTDSPGRATEIVRAALAAGYDRIVAVGGDGTFNEVVNGYFDGQTPLGSDIPLGFVPAGTGGDLRRSLGIGRPPEESLRVLAAGRTRRIDLGRATFVDRRGREQLRHFVNITSFGLGGLVDRIVNESSKALGGKASFLIGSVRAMLRYKNPLVRLRVDSGPDLSLPIANIAVANGQYFGGGMHVAPRARLDDGLFDVIVLGNFSRLELLRHTAKIYDGSHLALEKVQAFQGRRVVAESDQEVLIDMDGEPVGHLPITLEILPQALHVIAA